MQERCRVAARPDLTPPSVRRGEAFSHTIQERPHLRPLSRRQSSERCAKTGEIDLECLLDGRLASYRQLCEQVPAIVPVNAGGNEVLALEGCHQPGDCRARHPYCRADILV